jgi:hypothetical protein
MLIIAVTETNHWLFRYVVGFYLRDSWPDDALRTTLSKHIPIRRGCSNHDRETIPYIVCNSRLGKIQLQGLNVTCKYWWNGQSSENYHDVLKSFQPFIYVIEPAAIHVFAFNPHRQRDAGQKKGNEELENNLPGKREHPSEK